NRLKGRLGQAEKQVEELLVQTNQLTEDRDKWKGRIETIRKERDDLLVKIQDLSGKITDLEEEKETLIVRQEDAEETAENAEEGDGEAETDAAAAKEYGTDHWAKLLREKADLEV